jgi:adenylate cyclase
MYPGPKILFALVLFIALTGSMRAWGQVNDKKKKVDSLKVLLTNAGDDTGKVKLLCKLSEIQNVLDCNERLSYANSAYVLSGKLGWEEGICKSLQAKGDIYQQCFKDYAMAVRAFEQLEQIAKEYNSNQWLQTAYTGIQYIYQLSGNYAKAIDYSNRMIALKPGTDTLIGYLANLGQIYAELGDYKRALTSYQQSLKMLEDAILANKNLSRKYLSMRSGLLFTTGEIYFQMQDYDKALLNYEQALKGTVERNDQDIIAVTNIAIGRCYIMKKQAGKAIPYFETALSYRRGTIYEEEALKNIADAYVELKMIDSAFDHATKAMQAAIMHNNEPKLAQVYTTLGKIENYKQQYAIGASYLQKAIAITHKNGAKTDEKNAWEVLSASYTGLHQTQKAFDAYKQFITLRDSVYNADKAKELTRLDMQGEFDRKQTADSIKQANEKKIAAFKLQRQRMMSYSGFAGVAVLLLLSFLAYRNYSNEKKANAIISAAHETIKEEKQVSENLLLNILPQHVAEELKAKGDVEAKRFDNVTILFTDFVNFTSTAEKLTPEELVAELHLCFKAFDTIIGKYGIEKIKTIGDAYMAVCGLPSPDEAHAVNIVNAAIEIRDFMSERKMALGGNGFGIRLGVNSGSVVAGIVGIKKFAYDIWGDAVNTAARMEQKSEAGKINISQTTYELVKDRFTCTYRGEIEAKNKGMMKMYFVA